ncbi:MAG: hypothetical protein ACN4GW_06825 [Desulforhopalus sp.]
MLATDKIAGSFKAIVEEAENMMKLDPADEIVSGLKTIVSIAKHQSDIRGAKSGECKAHSDCK